MTQCCAMFCCCCCYLCESGTEYMETTWEKAFKSCAVCVCSYCDTVALRAQEKATQEAALNSAKCRAIILEAQAPKKEPEMTRV